LKKKSRKEIARKEKDKKRRDKKRKRKGRRKREKNLSCHPCEHRNETAKQILTCNNI
jgi:hypothetical protein